MPKGGVTVDTTFKQAEGAANTDKPAAATKTILLQIGSTAVLVDDQAIINDVAPVIRNDRTLVPIRVITEALGGQVAWNEAAKEVTLTVNGKEIKMTIGKALEKYGADANRWYFYTVSAPWIPKRYSGKAVMEGQRKFMSTLWNSYAFFVLYANIDEFDPHSGI